VAEHLIHLLQPTMTKLTANETSRDRFCAVAWLVVELEYGKYEYSFNTVRCNWL